MRRRSKHRGMPRVTGCSIRFRVQHGTERGRMPLRIHDALERWRAAEREMAATSPGTVEREDAEEVVVLAREEYLATVRVVAVEQGAGAMPDLTDTQVHRWGGRDASVQDGAQEG